MEYHLSQSVFKVFYRSQIPYKSVNLSFTITGIKNRLTDLYGNRLVQNDFRNTYAMKYLGRAFLFGLGILHLLR